MFRVISVIAAVLVGCVSARTVPPIATPTPALSAQEKFMADVQAVGATRDEMENAQKITEVIFAKLQESGVSLDGTQARCIFLKALVIMHTNDETTIIRDMLAGCGVVVPVDEGPSA